MARKQNGFGNPKSLGFKGVESRTDKGKKQGAYGSYPSNRRYGSSVQRTVIEKYNLDSDWTRWRKGYEYYNQGAYLEFTQLETKLYQGTSDETPVLFTGERFATKNADSHTHYSVKREVTGGNSLGKISRVFNDRRQYPENYARREIVAEVEGAKGANKELLRRAIGDRITDGKTAANITNVLDTNALPSVYFGKTKPEALARVEVTFPKIDIGDIEPQSLVGEVVALEDVRFERPINPADQFNDGAHFFGVTLNNETGSSRVKILDAQQGNLPPSLLDIAKLESIVETSGSFVLNVNYVFNKDDYQRFYQNTYLVADRVKQEVGTISYAILPFTIQSVTDTGTDIRVEAVPFMTSVQMFSKNPVRFVIFNDKSFTTKEVDTYDGVYYHQLGKPGEELWQRLNTDVDPWMDEVFVDGGFLTFADVYACSCPDYLHALLRMPEATSDGNATNRQRRAPLPTAQSRSTYEQLGLAQAAVTAASWETMDYKTSHRMCKHTVASNFIDRIKVVEPKGYPTVEARESFEKKLEKDIQEVAEEFADQLRRSEITTLEVVAALSSALNFDEVELANVILNSRF